MKSPLRKRLLRELKSEFGKYLVVFIMMAITIAFVSGFLVADGSMIRAYDDSFQKYNIEDGYFRTKKKLTTTQKEDIEKSDVKIYENFYIEQKLTNGSTVRFFKNRGTSAACQCLRVSELLYGIQYLFSVGGNGMEIYLWK